MRDDWITLAQQWTQRATLWIPPFLVLAAFMPYLSKAHGVRVENLSGVLLAAWAGMILMYRGRVSAALFPAFAVSVVLFLHVALATAFGSGLANLKTGFGRLDHYSRPIAVLLICATALRAADHDTVEAVFVRCAKLLVLLTTANAAIQVATIFRNTNWIVAPFRPSAGAFGYNVAEAAAGNARYVGIFNQPLEHGTVYAIAIILWVWLWHERRLPAWQAIVSLFAIVIGGALAQSKVFLIGGFPGALLLFFSRGIRPRDFALMATGVLVIMVAFTVFLTQWKGAANIVDFATQLMNRRLFLYVISGGRFGGYDYVHMDYGPGAMDALRASPVYGVGVGTSYMLMDNEYLMTAAEGGVFALFLVVLRLGLIVLPLLRVRLSSLDGRLLLVLTGVVALGSMGGPVTGIPRCGTIVWVFVGTLMLLVATDPRRLPVMRTG